MEPAMRKISAAVEPVQGPQAMNCTSTVPEGFDLKSWLQVNFASKEHKEEGQESCKIEENEDQHLDLTHQALLKIPERELNRIMGDKDKRISELEEEQRAIVQRINQVKLETAEEEEETAFIANELYNSSKMRKEAARKIKELEEAIRAERQLQQEAETRLAREAEESTKAQLALAQAEYNLESSRRQWEEDRSRLLAENKLETSNLMAAVTKAQEALDQERLKWQKEKSSLMEALKIIKQVLEDGEDKRNKCMDELTDRFMSLEKQMQEAQTKKKRKSAWKRFRQLFKRT